MRKATLYNGFCASFRSGFTALDHLLKWAVLMRVGFEDGRLDLFQKFPSSHCLRRFAPNGHKIHETADQIFDLTVVSSCNHSAND